ncbi:MAG: DivIVA domain-containing protein [Peptostreptococcaceae bacterium]|nr:DivIVA domain-containing protein [Peptostreptococcaceae bacterium]
MIMPIDIEKKEFAREKKGYNANEVDEYLDLITVDYEKLLNENRNMAHKLKFLEKQLQESQKADNSIVDTLESAKSLMADISASAERRAEIILKDAELEAESIKKGAKLEVSKAIEEQLKLKSQVERFRDKYKRMLEEETNRFNDDEYGFLQEIDEVKKFQEDRDELEKFEKETVKEERYSIDDTLIVSRTQEESPELEEMEPEDESDDVGEDRATVNDLADGLKNYSKQTLKGGNTLFN